MPDNKFNPLDALNPLVKGFPNPEEGTRIPEAPKRPADFPNNIPAGGYENPDDPNGPRVAGRTWRIPEGKEREDLGASNVFEFMFGGKLPNIKDVLLNDPTNIIYDLANKDVRDMLVNEGKWVGNFGNNDDSGATDVAKFFTEEPKWYDEKAHPEFHDESNPAFKALDFISKKLMQGRMEKAAKKEALQKKYDEADEVAYQMKYPRQGTTEVEKPK